jgi:hypothetical protein
MPKKQTTSEQVISMFLEDSYEDITESEANLIIDIHESIDEMVRNNIPVTLVRLGYELNIKPAELGDYLPVILNILNKVEEKYSV